MFGVCGVVDRVFGVLVCRGQLWEEKGVVGVAGCVCGWKYYGVGEYEPTPGECRVAAEWRWGQCIYQRFAVFLQLSDNELQTAKIFDFGSVGIHFGCHFSHWILLLDHTLEIRIDFFDYDPVTDIVVFDDILRVIDSTILASSTSHHRYQIAEPNWEKELPHKEHNRVRGHPLSESRPKLHPRLQPTPTHPHRSPPFHLPPHPSNPRLFPLLHHLRHVLRLNHGHHLPGVRHLRQ